QMVHPDRVVAEADLPTLPLVEPVYPLTEGLSLNQVGKAALAALARLPDMPEWQEPSWVARERFPSFADALRLLHRPNDPADILARLALGEIHTLIGTHAVFQEQVEFRDLALAVVDEQHRFGVHQRLALAKKGEAVDVLVMTATPIPRTLVLTYFGDMDVSEL